MFSVMKVFRAPLDSYYTFKIYFTIPDRVCNVLYALYVSSRSLDTDSVSYTMHHVHEYTCIFTQGQLPWVAHSSH